MTPAIDVHTHMLNRDWLELLRAHDHLRRHMFEPMMLSLGETTFGDPPLGGDERGNVFGPVNDEGDLAVGTDDRRAHRTPPTIF